MELRKYVRNKWRNTCELKLFSKNLFKRAFIIPKQTLSLNGHMKHTFKMA